MTLFVFLIYYRRTSLFSWTEVYPSNEAGHETGYVWTTQAKPCLQEV